MKGSEIVIIFIVFIVFIIQAAVGLNLYKKTKDKFNLLIAFVPFSLIFFITFLILEYRDFRSYKTRKPNESLNKLRSSESYKKLKAITGNSVGSFTPYCSYFEDGIIASYKDVDINEIVEKESYISVFKIKPFSVTEFASMAYISSTDYVENQKASTMLTISVFYFTVSLIFFPLKYSLALVILLLGIMSGVATHKGSPIFLGIIMALSILFIAYIAELIIVIFS